MRGSRMRTVGALFAGIAAIVFAGGAAAAEMYKWVDRNGVVHFQDTPPPEAATPVRVERIPTSRSEAPESAPAAPDAARPSPAVSPSAGAPAPTSAAAGSPRLKENPRVELYGTVWCPYCAKAREFFRSRGIAFSDYDIERDLAALNRKRGFDDVKGVPTVVIDGQVIHGFSEAAYLKALAVAP